MASMHVLVLYCKRIQQGCTQFSQTFNTGMCLKEFFHVLCTLNLSIFVKCENFFSDPKLHVLYIHHLCFKIPNRTPRIVSQVYQIIFAFPSHLGAYK